MKNVLTIGMALALAGVMAGLSASTAFAQGNAAGVIQYRQKVMSAQSGHLGGIGQILKNGLDFTAHIPQHAQAIADLAKLIPDLFPDGTQKGKTDALSEIWQDRDDFKDKARALETEAAKLARVALSGDASAIGPQVKKVGKACGACHKKYRQPKKKRYAWKKK